MSRSSRRAVLVGAGAALVAGCAGEQPQRRFDAYGDRGPGAVELLNGLLDLELQSVQAYRAVVSPLRGERRRMAETFLGHEREHARRLERAIRDLDGRPNRPNAAYELPSLRGERAAMEFAVEIERTATAAYLDILPRLERPELRAVLASILTVESEHAAVLLGALGDDALADAFVTGTS